MGNLDSDHALDSGESLGSIETYLNLLLSKPLFRTDPLLCDFLDPFKNAVETRLCEAPTAYLSFLSLSMFLF
jgi:hypothetical protein